MIVGYHRDPHRLRDHDERVEQRFEPPVEEQVPRLAQLAGIALAGDEVLDPRQPGDHGPVSIRLLMKRLNDVVSVLADQSSQAPTLKERIGHVLPPHGHADDRHAARAQVIQERICSKVKGNDRAAKRVRGQSGNELREVLFGATSAMKVIDDKKDFDPVASHGALAARPRIFRGAPPVYPCYVPRPSFWSESSAGRYNALTGLCRRSSRCAVSGTAADSCSLIRPSISSFWSWSLCCIGGYASGRRTASCCSPAISSTAGGIGGSCCSGGLPRSWIFSSLAGSTDSHSCVSAAPC